MRRLSPKYALLAIVTGVAGSLVALANPSTTAVAGTGTPTFATYVAPSNMPNRDFSGEPSIGVNGNTDAVMYQSYASTYKVKFNDATVPAAATWTNVTPTGSIENIDPILATDRVTGRTWAGGLAGECSTLWFSDTDGPSWSNSVNPCVGVFDHETIGSGPWHGAPPLGATYSRAVYYCAQTSYDACATSLDGGRTFLPPVIVGGDCGAQHGHVKVSADGTAYLPNSTCGGKVGGGISSNNGSSWTSYHITPSTAKSRGFDPSVATTPDNTVYQAWMQGSNYHPMVARSVNHGGNWDRITDLSNTVSPPIVASTFQSAVAGDDGRVAVAFLGTTTGSGIPFENGYHGVWNLYVSYSYDAGVTWTTVKATSDPVQRGCIWDLGGDNVCRNLLDFMDANVSVDGRVVVGYADGCVSACAGTGGTEAQSTTQLATISRQSTGKGLFGAYDGPLATPGAPTLTGSAGNGQFNLSWTTPSNTGGAITNYNVYRGTTSGGETLLTTVGVQNSYTDATAANGTTYYYKVAAVNSGGTGTLSNEVSGTPTATNTAPTACFTHSEAALTTNANASCSSDPDGPISSYAWSWGDSSTGSGATASHTYAASGTYTVTLTVTDANGATGTTSQSVSVSSTGDPDPATPNLTSGVAYAATSPGASGGWQYFKIPVPAGAALLKVDLNPTTTCAALCKPDLNLAVALGAKPLGGSTDCPQSSSSSEVCVKGAPGQGWWYVGVTVVTSGPPQAYSITATVT
jgi:PKD repeat protein